MNICNYNPIKTPDIGSINNRFKKLHTYVCFLASGGGGGGDVASVFGRTGAISATSGDYTFSQVTGAVGTSTDQTIGGVKTLSSAPIFSTMTIGSVLFTGTAGVLSQDNANLFWNNTDNRLGIGIDVPLSTLHVNNISTTQATFSGFGDGAAQAYNGQIAIGNNPAFQGLISYNGGNASLTIFNTYGTGASIIFRLATDPIFIPLKLQYDGASIFTSGIILPIVEKTANYTIVPKTDYTINCTSGSFTITLPTAVGIGGQIFIVKNSGAGTITIATTSSQTIDGTTPGTIAAGVVLRYQSTNANWILI